MSVKLILTDEQAEVCRRACEFYARVKLGQFTEIPYLLLDLKSADYCERRDNAEDLLYQARKIIYPGLSAARGSSYRLGKFRDADLAYDIHQVIRGTDVYSYNRLPQIERSSDDDKN